MSGDNSTGSGGSWNIQQNVVVTSDNIGDGDRKRVDDICAIIKQAGKNAISGPIGPSSPYTANGSHSNTTIFSLVGGVCWGTAIDYKHYLKKLMEKKSNNIVWGYVTGGGGACTMKNITTLKSYAHDWCYGDIATSEERNLASDKIVESYGGWVAGPDANSLAQAFLTGKGAGGGGGTGVAVEGILNAGKGTTPQHWNSANYTPFENAEISFTNFEITDENPRIKTATFETRQNIPMMSGRVAVLITGDCNDFGGIIIDKDFDSEKMIYKYKCQGFMDRIMANPIYVVANGSKTAHELITETLADLGLPDIYLKSAEDYDMAVTDETKMLMDKDKDLTETSDMINLKEGTKKEVSTKKSSSSSTSKTTSSTSTGKTGDSDDETIKTVTKTNSSTKDEKIKNTFLRKPVGIYDKDTVGDFIRTLIYDYGINVDFYGDINGIPHFEVMDLEAWQKVGWYISPDLGLDSNYQYKFSITNIITQVGIKNVQAANGNGELYTSEELLGIDLEKYVGRMGIIEDNPSTKRSGGDTTTIDQVNEQYQDSSGRKYNKTEVLETNGEPSCRKCTFKNGGTKPTQKKYKKSWLNKCPGCSKEKTLSDKSSGKDYKTQCSNCKLEFCQYCGYERKNGNHQLTELFNTSEKDDSNETKKKMTDTIKKGDS